jgi:hypothetical protein
MKLSAREMTLGCATMAVLITAGTWMWAESRLSDVASCREQKRGCKQMIIRAKKLLAHEDDWKARLGKLRAKLPQYDEDEQVTSEIMKMLEQQAAKAGLSLPKATPEKEKKIGDLYEMSINYRWEGDLSALVHFLYDLQSKGVNLDVRRLSAAPSSSRRQAARLKGNFTVDVAYTRASATSEDPNDKPTLEPEPAVTNKEQTKKEAK